MKNQVKKLICYLSLTLAIPIDTMKYFLKRGKIWKKGRD